MKMLELLSLVVALPIAALIWFLIYYRHYYSQISEIPGPKSRNVLIGNLDLFYEKGKSVGETSGRRLMSLAQQYKKEPMCKFYLGPKPIVLLYTPEGFQAILGNPNLIHKTAEYAMTEYWLGKGLAPASGARWKRSRKALQPAFHPKLLQNFIPYFNEHATVLCDVIKRKRFFEDVSKPIINTTLDIICDTTMGVQTNAQKGSDVHPYAKSLHRFTEIMIRRFFTPWYWSNFLFFLLPLGRELASQTKVMHKFTRGIVRERKALLVLDAENNNLNEDDPDRKLPFLDLLLKIHLNGELTEEEVREEVDTFAFGGHDTVGVSTTFALYCIGRNKEVQRKIQEELDDVFGDDTERPVNSDDLRQLTYLERVIKESLRLYPPAPVFGRHMTEDVTVGGKVIPKGTDVWLNVMALHRNAEVYPDPLSFDPDRFLPENSRGRSVYAYCPFSLGARICIGNKFAMMEEKVILATLLRRFSVKSFDEPEDLVFTFEIILRSQTPLRMEFTPREV